MDSHSMTPLSNYITCDPFLIATSNSGGFSTHKADLDGTFL